MIRKCYEEFTRKLLPRILAFIYGWSRDCGPTTVESTCRPSNGTKRMTSKFTFAVLNLSNFQTSENMARKICSLFINELEITTWLLLLCVSMNSSTSQGRKQSQTVVYYKSGNISKTCKTNTLLLLAYCPSNSANSHDLALSSTLLIYCKFFFRTRFFFVEFCHSGDDFNWHSTSRGPSAMADIFVWDTMCSLRT